MTKGKKTGDNWVWKLIISIEVVLALWLVLEIGLRIYIESPLLTDFYSSIPQNLVHQRQAEVGIRTSTGARLDPPRLDRRPGQ